MKDLLPCLTEKLGKAIGNQISFHHADGNSYKGADKWEYDF
jgi:hypothetical protein